MQVDGISLAALKNNENLSQECPCRTRNTHVSLNHTLPVELHYYFYVTFVAAIDLPFAVFLGFGANLTFELSAWPAAG